jgi:hypothetical protein
MNIMTDNKDLKYTQQFKKEPNIPKTYEQFILEQQNLYPDLVEGDVGEQKGCGPCHSCGNKELKFKLKVILKNCVDGEIGGTFYSTKSAEQAAQEIKDSEGH